MKNILLLAMSFSLIIFSISCRKKNEVDVTYATKPAHCFNLVKDGDETGIDDGGSCSDSGSSSSGFNSSCGHATNTAKIGSSNYSVSTCIKTVSGGQNIYTLSLTGGGKIVVETSTSVSYNSLLTYSSFPTASNEYNCDVTPPLSFTFSLSTADVKIKSNGTDIAVEICNGVYGPTAVSAYAIVN